MKKYKMIAFDVDGTILDSNGSMSEELKNIVKYLIKKDYVVTLDTARLPISAIEIAKELGLKPEVGIISLNGSFITNFKKEILYSKTFNWFSPYDLESIYQNVVINYYHKFDWLISKDSKYATREHNFLKNIVTPKIGTMSQVNKITIMGDNRELDTLKKSLLSFEEYNNYLIAFSHPNYLEITTTNINKFNALEYYADSLGIHAKEIIAFGDGENDIPMLNGVGLGVAMGNASQKVKDAAFDVTDSQDESGVVKYLEKLLSKNLL